MLADGFPEGESGYELDHASVTICGARPSNQDVLGDVHQDDLSCFILCDGVGGHAGGGVAASLVVETIRDRFVEEAAFGERALHSYVSHAAQCVRAKQSAEQALKEMSATVVALLIDRRNRCATWMHVGDTRLYLFRHGEKYAVTKDHSVAQQFIDAGLCKPDALARHPHRGQLFAAIGAGDGNDLPSPASELALLPGDVFLICTDGVWENITDTEMDDSLAQSRNAQEWLATIKQLCEGSAPAGKQPSDNCSAVAVWVKK